MLGKRGVGDTDCQMHRLWVRQARAYQAVAFAPAGDRSKAILQFAER